MTSDGAHCEVLAVYGTLRRRSVFHKLPVAAARLQFISYGLIRGRVFWQRTYPALIEDRGIAQVELFRIVDPNVLEDLDRYEGFDSTNLRASLFVRTQVLLLNPQVRAWVYILNLQIARGTQQRDFTTKTQRTRRFEAREGIVALRSEVSGGGVA
jgi:gamma-glutamylcyclotransferase (GGCT)/AIG2-like uncharacterized protein YtfP